MVISNKYTSNIVGKALSVMMMAKSEKWGQCRANNKIEKLVALERLLLRYFRQYMDGGNVEKGARAEE